MQIALAQLNTTVGDFEGNREQISASISRAREGGADLVVFPELSVCGYPPLDLLDRPGFVEANAASLEGLAACARDIAVVVGAVVPAPGAGRRKIANAAVVLVEGEIAHVQWKTLLPTYDVFDEARYFAPAPKRTLWSFGGQQIGFAICEDLWSGAFWGDARPYPIDPVGELADAGADLIVALSASPYEHGKIAFREEMICDASRDHGLPIVFANQIGGNDEIVFDGSSFATDPRGRVIVRLARFEPDLAIVSTATVADAPGAPGSGSPAPGSASGSSSASASVAEHVGPEPVESDIELLERALVLGIRDYLHKQGFARAVVGLSGGIDSAVTATLAARALGPENVSGILMPSPYSSAHSIDDALELGRNLGIDTRIVKIETIYRGFLAEFAALFGASPDYGLTQENVQARIRGTLLMAVSNFENRIVLATGNKSELSVGYTTLYGDLVGGVAVIGDVLKRDVYALARFANRDGVKVPWSTIEKPPSAELRPDQLDSDSLPDYDDLDRVLEAVLERGRPHAGLELEGISRDTIDWVLRALDRAEYKRRQAPVILRVSPKAFGIGRRVPIVQRGGWAT